MKVSYKQFFFEFLLVLLAVILAIILTEFRLDYLNSKLAKKSFNNILEEVIENVQAIRSDSAVLSNDLQFTQKWIKSSQKRRKTEPFDIHFENTLLSNSALQVAKINQSLTYLEDETIEDITKLYSLQDVYFDNGKKVYSMMADLVGESTNSSFGEKISSVERYEFQLKFVLDIISLYLRQAEKFTSKYN